MKIFLLEDDLLVNEIIEEHLLLKGHEVVSRFNGNDAEEILYSEVFDLLLLDVNVPDIDGFELLGALRGKGIRTPTIYITSLVMVDDIEKGFDSGCDDYLKKPFELKELDLRINNIKRLFKIENDEIVSISNSIKIDKKNLLVYVNKKQVHITVKELNVLEYLMKNKDIPVSVEELSNNIWSYEYTPMATTIRTYIKNLRKMLGEEYITNIRGVGYRFNSK
ncbi:MAG: response regulator transcription factor [Arcobacteraceae bacterium]